MVTKPTGVGRGGRREGAGRKRIPSAPPTPELVDEAAVDAAAEVGPTELAKALAVEAIKTLRTIARHGKSEAARVAAADKILDRALGKPAPGGGKPASDATDKLGAAPKDPWDDLLEETARPN